MDERRPLTKEQQVIQAWAHRTGVPMPDGGATVDPRDGQIHGGCLKFGLGKPDEDDVALLGRMKGLGYQVFESKDKLSWEWVISPERYQQNLKEQHTRAIEQTRPKKNEVVSPGESGYYDEPGEFVPTGPMDIDKLLSGGPDNKDAIRSYEDDVLAAG